MLLLTWVVVISLNCLLIDERRRLLKVRNHWYPVMQQLHRFMIAVSRVAANHDGRDVLPLIRLFGIREVSGRRAGLT